MGCLGTGKNSDLLGNVPKVEFASDQFFDRNIWVICFLEVTLLGELLDGDFSD